jgi:hypothetical protein
MKRYIIKDLENENYLTYFGNTNLVWEALKLNSMKDANKFLEHKKGLFEIVVIFDNRNITL